MPASCSATLENDLDIRQMRRARNRSVAYYDQHAALQAAIAEELIKRLDPCNLQPDKVLDIYSATGCLTGLLRNKYPQAALFGSDCGSLLLPKRRWTLPWRAPRVKLICSELHQMPIRSETLDLVLSNLSLAAFNSLDAVLTDIKRVIRQNGLFSFSMYGPDTLRELRAAWAEVDEKEHIHRQADMHDVGDALIRAGFTSPVLDVDYFTLTYAHLDGLFKDLKYTGQCNARNDRRRSLTGQHRFTAMKRVYEKFRTEGRLPATIEIIFGHAWVPLRAERPQDGSTVRRMSASALQTMARRKKTHVPNE